MKTPLVIAAVLLGVGAVIAVSLNRPPPSTVSAPPAAVLPVPREPESAGTTRPDSTRNPDRSSRAPEASAAAPKPGKSPAPAPETEAPPGPASASTAVTPPPQGRQKAPPHDPLAREALRYAGISPTAEAYWLTAINNPALPAEERKDLIEDLNEDGFGDPENPTLDELPLIASRLRLIEELAPMSIDRVNADAFKEAHKDLTEMYRRLTEGG